MGGDGDEDEDEDEGCAGLTWSESVGGGAGLSIEGRRESGEGDRRRG